MVSGFKSSKSVTFKLVNNSNNDTKQNLTLEPKISFNRLKSKKQSLNESQPSDNTTSIEYIKSQIPISIDSIQSSDCYFPLDGYDYSQHLRSIRETNFVPFNQLINDAYTKSNLGSKPDDSSFDGDEEGELDDDFVFQAAGTDNLEDIDISQVIWGDSYSKSNIPDVSSLKLDINDDEFDTFLDEFTKDIDLSIKNPKPIPKETVEIQTLLPVDKEIIDKIVNMNYNESDFSNSEGSGSDVSGSDTCYEQWDCETVITSFSNLLNNPKKIPLPRIQQKEVDKSHKYRIDREDVEVLPPIDVTRRKDETLEEKRQRKLAVKQARALIRQAKKENKILYKSVKISQQVERARTSYNIPCGVRHYVMTAHTN